MLADKLGLILSLVSLVNGDCTSRTVTAETSSGYLSHLYYSSNEDCTFKIVPDSEYEHYFLEISWTQFDVRGDMPDCNKDYIEVYLTRSEKSIGKFCSNNLQGSSLFKMYSHDGYAQIRFHSDDSGIGNGFSLSYRLRSSEYDTLSGYSGCSSQYLYSSSDVFYSAAWPESYKEYNPFDCKINIDSGGITKIIFMDLDLRRTSSLFCNQYTDDYVEIQGSNIGDGYQTQLKAPFCSTSKIVTFVTTYRFVYVNFKRRLSTESSKRGLVAGYVSYTAQHSSTNMETIIIVLGVTIPVLFILGGVIGCITCAKYQKRPHAQSEAALIQSQHYPTEIIVGREDEWPQVEAILPSYEEAVSPYQASASQISYNTPQPAFNPTYGST